MHGYLHSFEWMRTLWPLLVVAGLVSLAVWLGYLIATAEGLRRSPAGKAATTRHAAASGGDGSHRLDVGDGSASKALLVISSFSMLGITIGWLTGDSGEQVLASVLPAVLTLIGGLAVFLVGKQMQDATMIASALIGLTVNLLVGALLASENTLMTKELALEENRHAFRTQVSVETGLKGDSEIDKLQQKIIEQVQHASGS